MSKSFKSDNYSGCSQEILQYLNEINFEHQAGYGDDQVTQEALKYFKKEFGEEVEVFFVFNGTGANVVSLKAMVKSYNSIICASTAHINVNEVGAPEAIIGSKLLAIQSEDGKITLEQIKRTYQNETSRGRHSTLPKVVSLTQCTELGTVYEPEEITKISDWCHQNDLYLHVDGARISNAAAGLQKSFAEITKDCGVDVLSFGGTKNGLMFGEAVIFFEKNLAKEFAYLQKQNLQLCSKMRFLSGQFVPFFRDELWLKNSLQANQTTEYLEKELRKINEVRITQKVESNHVFAVLPKEVSLALEAGGCCYIWNQEKGEVRFVTSFDTTEEDVRKIVSKIKELIAQLTNPQAKIKIKSSKISTQIA
jgi:threonine aldolase